MVGFGLNGYLEYRFGVPESHVIIYMSAEVNNSVKGSSQATG